MMTPVSVPYSVILVWSLYRCDDSSGSQRLRHIRKSRVNTGVMTPGAVSDSVILVSGVFTGVMTPVAVSDFVILERRKSLPV